MTEPPLMPGRKSLLLGDVLLVCLSGCGLDSEGQATEAAAEAVPSRVALARDTAAAVLTDPDLEAQTVDQRLAALATAAGASDRAGIFFGQRVGHGGRLTIALHA
ncbi:hypothetical protein [Micromonospora avicenniae]|uniref:hypothetical protein n=1 Tax=Micromonospora avicenniae TaxID=1198245 RepID=UPI003431E19C